MVFDSNGRWIPNNIQYTPNALPQVNQAQVAPQPQANPAFARMPAQQMQLNNPQTQMSINPAWSNLPSIPMNQAPQQSRVNSNWIQPNQNWFQSQQQQQQQPQPSVEQSVNSSSPQSVQNFLSALNQVGAGSNNTFMNQQGAQGAGPQAGFQGFQQNGSQGGGTNWQGYGGQMQSQLGSYGNQSWANGNYGGGGVNSGSGVQQNGTGGNLSQPGYANYSNGTYTQNAPGPNANAQFVPPPSPMVQTPQVSDQTAKQNIDSGEAELQDFLSNLGVYSFEYKDKQYGDGRRIAPMAQEIEKSPLGAQAIVTNKEGYKMVDYGKLAGVQLAATAMLNHKYNELEKKIKSMVLENIRKGKK